MSFVKIVIGGVVVVGGAALAFIILVSRDGSPGTIAPATPVPTAPSPGAGDSLGFIQRSDDEGCEDVEMRNGWIIGCLLSRGGEPIFRCGFEYEPKYLGRLVKLMEDRHPTGVDILVWPGVPQPAVDQVQKFFEERGLRVHLRTKN